MDKIFSDLGNWAGEGADPYFKYYLGNLPEIDNSIQKRESPQAIIRTQLDTGIETGLLDRIRISCLFNNLTQVVVPSAKELNISIPSPEAWAQMYNSKELVVQIPSGYIEHLDLEPTALNEICPGFIIANTPEMEALLLQLQPLIRTKTLCVSPERAFMVRTNSSVPGRPNNRTWHMMRVEDDCRGGPWRIASDFASSPNPVIAEDAPIVTDEIVAITLPYIQKVPMDTFASILMDEADKLVTFRAGMRQLLDSAKRDKKSVNEIKSDVIEPSIEKIARRMKQIKENRNVKLVL